MVGMTVGLPRRSLNRILFLTAGVVAVGLLVGVLLGRESGRVETPFGEWSLIGIANAAPDSATTLVTQDVAATASLQRLALLEPQLAGFVRVRTEHVPSLVRAESRAGDDAFVTDTPLNAYVFEFTAPPTPEFKYVRALVVVNAVTGEVESASVLQNNE
jgi:hypothetical protein